MVQFREIKSIKKASFYSFMKLELSVKNIDLLLFLFEIRSNNYT